MRQITLEELIQIAVDSKQDLYDAANSVGRVPNIYLHWSAGHHYQVFEDYHININAEGEIYLSEDNLSTHLNHTYMRNTGCIGIAMACCAFASPENLGDEPPTEAQIDTMERIVAILSKYLDIPCDANNVMTHAEAALIDGYGFAPGQTYERWDLAILRDGDEWMNGGNELRDHANWYLNNTEF
jgi:hypothetical protein